MSSVVREATIIITGILLIITVLILAPAIFAWSAGALFGWAFWPSFWIAFAAGIIIRGAKASES